MNITFLEMLHKIRQVRQIILNNYRSTKQSIWRPPLHQFWSDLEAFRTQSTIKKRGWRPALSTTASYSGGPKLESRSRHRLRLLSVQCFPQSLYENSRIALQHRRNPLPNPPIWHSQSFGDSTLHNPFRLKSVLKRITYVCCIVLKLIKVTNYLDMTLYTMTDKYQHFGEKCFVHLLPRRWTEEFRSKHQHLSRLQGITSYNTVILPLPYIQHKVPLHHHS